MKHNLFKLLPGREDLMNHVAQDQTERNESLNSGGNRQSQSETASCVSLQRVEARTRTQETSPIEKVFSFP